MHQGWKNYVEGGNRSCYNRDSINSSICGSNSAFKSFFVWLTVDEAFLKNKSAGWISKVAAILTIYSKEGACLPISIHPIEKYSKTEIQNNIDEIKEFTSLKSETEQLENML